MNRHLVLLFLAAIAGKTLGADNAAALEAGKLGYANCMACHGPDGKGLAAGPSKMAPSLAASAYVNGDPAILTLIVTKGIAKEGTEYLGMMAPMGGVFPTDDKLAAILTYVRASFGNTSPGVTPEEAKAYREKWKDITAPVTRAKLKELAEAKK